MQRCYVFVFVLCEKKIMHVFDYDLLLTLK